MKKALIFIILIFSSVAYAQNLENIKWITEIYPPSNFNDKQGVLRGYTVDILLGMWEKVGLKKGRENIDVVPWARGLAMLENDKSVCLFGMGITEERKKKYHFVGRTPGNIQALIAKKEKKFKFNSIENVNQEIKKRRIGVVRGDIGTDTFLNSGGKPELLIFVVEGSQLVKMLDDDRLDLIAFADTPTFKNMKKIGISPAKYEIVLPMLTSYWGYSFNKNVNPEILEKLQKAYDELFEQGTVMRIRNAYVNE
ncbi:MAG: ABC transporter substrate-binding protein [Desulfobacteraceae bacterium]|nr:ABC transporter substrate-binding protein [Desulfobacteraceae bacterium]